MSYLLSRAFDFTVFMSCYVCPSLVGRGCIMGCWWAQATCLRQHKHWRLWSVGFIIVTGKACRHCRVDSDVTEWSGGSCPIPVGCGMLRKYWLTSWIQDISLFFVALSVVVLLIVTAEAEVAYPVSVLSVLGLRGEVKSGCLLSVDCRVK